MSAAITAIAITAAATLYSAEQQRVAQSKADDAAGDEMKKIQREQDWKNKKKGINDQNAAIAAMRLRGEPGNANGNPIAGAAGVSTPGATGVLGVGPSNAVATAAGVNDKLNSPLGL